MWSKTRPVKLSARTKGQVLKLNGVGFKSFVVGSNLVTQLGYSHYLVTWLPLGSTVRSHKQGLAVVSPAGNLANRVQNLRQPDPYKARGIYRADSKPTLKEGKRR